MPGKATIKPPTATKAGQPLGERLLWGRSRLRTMVRILVLAAICGVTFKFVLIPVRVTGRSMEPTCLDGEIGVVNRLAYHGSGPQRGDIVGFRLVPGAPILLKRLVGLPGEKIAIHVGTVLINGTPLAEPYVASPGTWEWPEETLADGTYYAVGDNRSISLQFHANRSQILGQYLGRQH